ncbi:MAG: hypothetical protein NW241_06140 [Bacteroidia bacterium]|nr:hypothetical protein [Bacteroidia bacterium]
MTDHPTERHRIGQYYRFAEIYEVQQLDLLVRLYDVDDLEAFMPPAPSPLEKQVFNELLGVQGVSGYMDWEKSANTLELILQWQERTGNHGLTRIEFQV